MAAILIIAGGLVGFASAIASMLFLNTGVLLALGIWSGIGTMAFVLAIAISLLPRRTAALAQIEQTA